MNTLMITPGPTMVVSEAPDDRDVRWCFRCRAHRPHMWVLLDHDRQSYRGPLPVLRCPTCLSDNTTFPRSTLKRDTVEV